MIEEDKKHLIDSLNQYYKVSVDDKKTRYMGINLQWDHKNQRVHISMPGYLPKALKIFGHETPPKLQDKTYPHAPHSYGEKIQYAKAIDNYPPLSNESKHLSLE